VGPMRLAGLGEGKWRELSEREIRLLLESAKKNG
jgi:hypothetical protein